MEKYIAQSPKIKKRALKDNRLDDANEEVIQRRLAIYEDDSAMI